MEAEKIRTYSLVQQVSKLQNALKNIRYYSEDPWAAFIAKEALNAEFVYEPQELDPLFEIPELV